MAGLRQEILGFGQISVSNRNKSIFRHTTSLAGEPLQISKDFSMLFDNISRIFAKSSIDIDIDGTKGNRFHPLEILFSMGIKFFKMSGGNSGYAKVLGMDKLV